MGTAVLEIKNALVVVVFILLKHNGLGGRYTEESIPWTNPHVRVNVVCVHVTCSLNCACNLWRPVIAANFPKLITRKCFGIYTLSSYRLWKKTFSSYYLSKCTIIKSYWAIICYIKIIWVSNSKKDITVHNLVFNSVS